MQVMSVIIMSDNVNCSFSIVNCEVVFRTIARASHAKDRDSNRAIISRAINSSFGSGMNHLYAKNN